MLGYDRSEVAARLMADTGAVFGRRRLLWRRGNGVQWSPADDCYVAARVDIRYDAALVQPAISAHIFDVGSTTGRRD